MYSQHYADLKSNFSPFQKKERMHEPSNSNPKVIQHNPRRINTCHYPSPPMPTRSSPRNIRLWKRKRMLKRNGDYRYNRPYHRNLKNAKRSLPSTARKDSDWRVKGLNCSNARKNSSIVSRSCETVMNACGSSTTREVTNLLSRRIYAGYQPGGLAPDDPRHAIPERPRNRHWQYDLLRAAGAGGKDGKCVKRHHCRTVPAVGAVERRGSEGGALLYLLLQHKPWRRSQPPALSSFVPRRLHQGVALQGEDLSTLQAGTTPYQLIPAHSYMLLPLTAHATP